MPEHPILDSTSNRPLVLICNDDGIDAAGISALASALQGLGDLAVAAPFQEQSAVGHAITVRDPIRAHKWQFVVGESDVWARAITGTPADCVKIACQRLLSRQPDLVVSGINHGPNTAVSALYSGTVSAATEGAILGIPGIAVSHCGWSPTDFEGAGRAARGLAEYVLQNGLPERVVLNVNVPDLPSHELSGLRLTRQARGRWEEEYEERRDPQNRPYFWAGGEFLELDAGDDTDLAAIREGYVSVTPIQFDLTAYETLDSLDSDTDFPNN